MYGSDVDSINVDLEFFQSGDILTVPLLHLASNQDKGEIQGDNEQKIGPVWELAQLGFETVAQYLVNTGILQLRSCAKLFLKTCLRLTFKA